MSFWDVTDVHHESSDEGDLLSQSYLYINLIALVCSACIFSFSRAESFFFSLMIQIELLACGQVGTPLLAGRQSELLGTCPGEVVLVSWGGGVLRSRLAW